MIKVFCDQVGCNNWLALDEDDLRNIYQALRSYGYSSRRGSWWCAKCAAKRDIQALERPPWSHWMGRRLSHSEVPRCYTIYRVYHLDATASELNEWESYIRTRQEYEEYVAARIALENHLARDMAATYTAAARRLEAAQDAMLPIVREWDRRRKERRDEDRADHQ